MTTHVRDQAPPVLGHPRTDAYDRRGWAYHNKGDFEKAIADYTEVIRLNPNDAAFYSSRGHVYVHLRQWDKAIADCTEALRLDPKYAWAFNNRGWAYDDIKAYDKAVADYTAAIKIDPKYADAYNRLAWLLATNPSLEVRDGQNAVKYATKACELSAWKNSNTVNTLAAAYAETGNFDQAAKWQKKVLADANSWPKEQLEGAQLRLKMYREHKPYRDLAKSSNAPKSPPQVKGTGPDTDPRRFLVRIPRFPFHREQK